MANDEITLMDERQARLETTVANGFHGNENRFGALAGRMDRLEDRMFALENKLDVVADSIRADLKTVLEAVTASTEEMRRTTAAIRSEHQADRRLMMWILDDHGHRLRALEERGGPTTTA